MHTQLEFFEFIIECLLFNPHIYLMISYKLNKMLSTICYNNWLDYVTTPPAVHRASCQLLELLARFGTYNSPKQLIYKKRVLVLFYSWISFPIPAFRTLTLSYVCHMCFIWISFLGNASGVLSYSKPPQRPTFRIFPNTFRYPHLALISPGDYSNYVFFF